MDSTMPRARSPLQWGGALRVAQWLTLKHHLGLTEAFDLLKLLPLIP